MRQSHGLRAVIAGGIDLNPLGINPGDSLGGGYFAGYISHKQNGRPTHALITAPAATGASGTGYAITTLLQWKTTSTYTDNAIFMHDGAPNAPHLSGGLHPASDFCTGLTIGGYSDWYLPALHELEIAYFNLKPTTDFNHTWQGSNYYAVPKRSDDFFYGTWSTNPSQASAIAFQSGGAEAFAAAKHWTSTGAGEAIAWAINLQDGSKSLPGKTETHRVRAFRKIAL